MHPPGLVRREELPPLDGLRALAVLAVLLTHVGFQTGHTLRGTSGAVLARLDFGVTVFFLLSGFLLYLPWARAHLGGTRPPRTRRYLRNRALRVLPAYVVLVAVVLPALTPEARDDPAEWATQLLLLQTFTPEHLLAGMTHTWSLAVEVSFYLALPLLAAIARPRRPLPLEGRLRREVTLLAVMTAVGLVWVGLVHGAGLFDQRVSGLWLPGYLLWFSLGMGVAVAKAAYELRPPGERRLLDELGDAGGTCVVVAVLLFWLTTTPLAGPRDLTPPTGWEALAKHVLYGLAALFLLLPAVFGTTPRSAVKRVLASGPARRLGRISYGVFLWHLLALHLVFEVPGLDPFEGHVLQVLVLTLALSLVLAELSLRLVELPALRWKRPAGAG